jgi:hypothetical protein
LHLAYAAAAEALARVDWDEAISPDRRCTQGAFWKARVGQKHSKPIGAVVINKRSIEARRIVRCMDQRADETIAHRRQKK